MKPVRKVCHNCRKVRGWTCRVCGAQCCAHRCGNMVGDKATCGKCRMANTRRI